MGFVFDGTQVLSMLLGRSLNPDILNRHKQVHTLQLLSFESIV